jgi:hypothetical protein
MSLTPKNITHTMTTPKTDGSCHVTIIEVHETGIVMRFSEPTTWFGIDRESAKSFGLAIIQAAEQKP